MIAIVVAIVPSIVPSSYETAATSELDPGASESDERLMAFFLYHAPRTQQPRKRPSGSYRGQEAAVPLATIAHDRSRPRLSAHQAVTLP